MQELIDKLKAEAGLTEKKLKRDRLILRTTVAENNPMLAGMAKNFFGK